MQSIYRTLLYSIVILLFGRAQSQGLFLDWVKESESGVSFLGNATCIDPDGNFYVLHRTSYGGKDMDPGIGETRMWTKKKSDAVFNKFDKNGKFQWSKLIVDSLETGVNIIKASSKYVYLAGRMVGQYTPNYLDTPSQTLNIGDREGHNVILKYNKGDGSFVRAIDFDKNIAVQDIHVLPNDDIWVAGSYNDNVDLDPGSGNITSDGDRGTFLSRFNSDDSMLMHWSQGMGIITAGGISSGNNHVMMLVNVNRRTNKDTLFFGEDTIILVGGGTNAYLIFNDKAVPENTISAGNQNIAGVLVAKLADDELLIGTQHIARIDGLINATFPAFPKVGHGWRYSFKTKTYIQEDSRKWGIPIGKWKGDYLIFDDSFQLKRLDSATDKVKFRFTPKKSGPRFSNTGLCYSIWTSLYLWHGKRKTQFWYG